MEIIEQATQDWLHAQLGVDFQIEKHSYSNQDDVYKILTSASSFYLKTNDLLRAEHDNMRKLQPYLSIPRVIGYANIDGRDHLLMTEMPGDNLAELVGKWNTTDIVKEFAKAVKHFHSLRIADIFPDSNTQSDFVVLHGDMSFPNIIFTEPGAPSFIDLGQVSVGAPDSDLADAIWSLQRNIGPGYGEQFLEEYGDFVMTDKVEAALRFRYTA